MIKLVERYDQILATLQRDGRITKAALADEVNLSPSPCWERLKRLEEIGLIEGYHARLDLGKLTRFTTVLVEVTLQRHQAEDFEKFETYIKDRPEVLDCWATGGGIDYMLRVVAKDVDAYQRIIVAMLEDDIGIDRYFTYIVTSRVKEATEIPLDQLL